jgi:transcriptional regulator with XRE-family HTH domain
METLGKRIRRERQSKQLTVRGFARQIGVAPPFVTDIEADRRRPSPEVLARIAQVLGVPLAELEALDPRLTAEVKEWIADEPRVGRLLRQLREAPDPNSLLGMIEDVVEREAKREDER